MDHFSAKLSFIVFSCKNITDHYHIPCPNCLIPFIHYWCSNHFQIKKKKKMMTIFQEGRLIRKKISKDVIVHLTGPKPLLKGFLYFSYQNCYQTPGYRICPHLESLILLILVMESLILAKDECGRHALTHEILEKSHSMRKGKSTSLLGYLSCIHHLIYYTSTWHRTFYIPLVSLR